MFTKVILNRFDEIVTSKFTLKYLKKNTNVTINRWLKFYLTPDINLCNSGEFWGSCYETDPKYRGSEIIRR